MGIFKRWSTKVMLGTVRKSLPDATAEKLVTHYNKLQEAYRLTDDVQEQAEILRLQQDIAAELGRRGITTRGG